MEQVVEEVCGILRKVEGLSLVAYADPGTGGAPWTIGYGETKDVHKGDVWTLEYAENVLRARVIYFLTNVYARCPQLFLEPSGRAVACTSLAYNIGLGAFAASSVCRLTKSQEFSRAATAFLLWNKAGGRVMRGLTNRRKYSSSIYLRGY